MVTLKINDIYRVKNIKYKTKRFTFSIFSFSVYKIVNSNNSLSKNLIRCKSGDNIKKVHWIFTTFLSYRFHLIKLLHFCLKEFFGK